MVREVSLIGRKYYQNKNCTERFHEDLPLIEENQREKRQTERVFVEESLDRKMQPMMGVLAK